MSRLNLICPRCKGPTNVTDSRKNPVTTKRRRQCLNRKCGYRFTTVERVFFKDELIPIAEKTNGSPPIYLLTTRLGVRHAIEAVNRPEAISIAKNKGWTINKGWNLTYVGWPAKKMNI